MFEGRLNKIIVFFIYISVFVNSYVFTKEPAEIYFGYVIYIVLLPVFIVKHPFPKHIGILFSILLFTGILNIFLDNDTVPLFLKIFLGLFFSYLFYYYVVLHSEFNIEKLFQLYLKGCYIVAIIGIIQFVSFHIGFKYGYNFTWILNKWGVNPGGNFGIRINSIFAEPTYFATCVSAGVFVCIYNLLVKRPYYLTKSKSLFILIVYGLTFSGVAYTALLVAIIILLLNFGFIRYMILFIPILMGAFYYLYNNVSDFKERYDGTVDIFSTGEFSIGKTHGSSIILYDNYQVAMNNFSNNFLFGTGLGSHPVAYEKYSITKDIGVGGISQNNLDASSMLFRLLSETGLFGTGLMLIIYFRCFIKRRAESSVPEYFWIISGGIFVMITVNLLRQGHYFLNGFPFFIWMYYYNYVNYKKYLSDLSVKESHAETLSEVSTIV